MLKNKIVFITGASSGIGAACAAHFAKHGANLLLCARRIDKVQSLATTLQDQYQIKVHAFPLDVRNRNEVNQQIESLPANWQEIDILINNAGLAAGLDSIQDANIDDWEAMIDTNVKGLLYVTKKVLPQMIARNVGHIINIGSVAGHTVYPKGSVYCATKHAVKVLTEALRLDLSGTPIRVSTIDPGAVETNFSVVRFKGDTARAAAVYENMQPLTADDIADAVLYAASRPAHVNISEMLIMPTDQAAATIVTRRKKDAEK